VVANALGDPHPMVESLALLPPGVWERMSTQRIGKRSWDFGKVR